MWNGFIWLSVPAAGSCEHCNEPLGSIKGGEFLDQLSNYIFSKSVLHGRSELFKWVHIQVSKHCEHMYCLVLYTVQ